MQDQAEPSGNQLLGEGRPFTLLDGTVVRLKFGHRALLKVEELFGGYRQMETEIRAGMDTPKGNAVTKAGFACLQHDPQWRDAWGKWVDSIPHDRCLVATSPEGESLEEAVIDAFVDAHPPRPAQETSEQPPTPTATTTQADTPGPSSTPQREESSASATTNSGT